MNKELDIQQYKNLLMMLKNILVFYGNESHYKSDPATSGLSIMMVDEGHQARYAMDLIKNLEDQNIDAEAELSAIMNDEIMKEHGPFLAQELINTIKTMKRDEEV